MDHIDKHTEIIKDAVLSASNRHEYFNPALAENADYYEDGGDLLAPDGNGRQPNLESSLCFDGKHRPALDIDIPIEVRPSSTPGHSHVLFPTVALEWEAYDKLLKALADAGIIEEKYYWHSVNRGQSLLRKPGIKKHYPAKNPMANKPSKQGIK